MIDLNFEQGNQQQPKGHAILYFRSPSDVLATYIVVLPLMVDFTRYIPPLMASQVKDVGLEQFSAFAMPPVPEKVDSYQLLVELASARGDDLIYGGDVAGEDFLEAAERVNRAVQRYAQLFRSGAAVAHGERALQGEVATPELSVGEVVYSLMNERDKLGELTKLVGKLRFTVEGKDAKQVEEAEAEMRALARYLPESFRISRLINAVKRSVESGSRLTELYLERCYKLSDEDYTGLKAVEEAIRGLEPTAEES